jgi:hypothetical protein
MVRITHTMRDCITVFDEDAHPVNTLRAEDCALLLSLRYSNRYPPYRHHDAESVHVESKSVMDTITCRSAERLLSAWNTGSTVVPRVVEWGELSLSCQRVGTYHPNLEALRPTHVSFSASKQVVVVVRQALRINVLQ